MDKTQYIYKLITEGKHYFFSRPRRFGKSLFISTLESLFRGEKSLFNGLAITHTDYDFKVFPVIKLEFAKNEFATTDQLREYINFAIDMIATNNNIPLNANNYNQRFEELVTGLHQQTGQKVALLIDEYDKPILNNLNSPILTEIKQVLNAFYSVVKSVDEHLKFVFITGVSKFAKMSVLTPMEGGNPVNAWSCLQDSGMNSLSDISMDHDFAHLCGITQTELENNFAPIIKQLSTIHQLPQQALLAQIKQWYNGYLFEENVESVYNPYSLLNLFKSKKFKNYWFETATPTFLLDLLQNKQYDLQDLTETKVGDRAFSACEPEDMGIQSIFLQTGYLTIKSFDNGLYQLDFPNYEVKRSFYDSVAERYSRLDTGLEQSYTADLIEHLNKQQFDDFFNTLAVFFANIPYDIQLKNEKYYQSLFYAIFKLIGLSIAVEVRTNKGRIDCVIETDSMICLIEFKLHKDKKTALQQIIDTEYDQKYQLSEKQKFLIGVEFDQQSRNIGGYELVKG